jgi:hypothetical protein
MLQVVNTRMDKKVGTMFFCIIAASHFCIMFEGTRSVVSLTSSLFFFNHSKEISVTANV